MRIISFDNIKDLNISPKVCFQWVDEMIANKDQALLPAKISMKTLPGVFCNVMPCILENTEDDASVSEWGGVKIVTRYPEREPSLDSRLLLYNAGNGDFLAFMDADWITTMRTGAVAAHSVMLLAKTNFFVLGMLGLGNAARATILVLAAMLPERELHIKLLKYKGQEILFKERFSEYSNLHFTYEENIDEIVRGSDVVISAATYLPFDLCGDEVFDPGVLVVPVHTLGFTNCDLFFDKIYADDYGHVCDFKNFSKFKYFAEVSDIVNQKAVGRENDEERILVYNIGIAMHDINFAAHIYRLLENCSNIVDVDLHTPEEKFWI